MLHTQCLQSKRTKSQSKLIPFFSLKTFSQMEHGSQGQYAAPPPPAYQPPQTYPPPSEPIPDVPPQQPGATYYTPPPQHPPGYQSGLPNVPNQPYRNRIASFYAPPDNRSLAVKRRLFSFICCCIMIALIVGLAAGLTRRSYGCNCNYDYQCRNQFGPRSYCHNCRCVR
ncbi:hypothetical protein BJV82DRAFT_617621 [Fennellomyces sp. T-0311]|nr:hypothetical protein BJV82DRAFT_617621 [Fennellomyces sp. T-0311]